MKDKKVKKVSLSKGAKSAIISCLLAVFLLGGIVYFSNHNGEREVSIIPSENPSVVDPSKDPVVVEPEEKLLKPFNVNANVERYYFEINDPSGKQEQALLEYNGKYMPSTAMEYSYNNNKFDVVASFSGVVSERKLDPLYGYMVYIKNSDGLTAIYGSLADVTVSVGDNVKQGDVLGKASTNNIDSTLNNHLHFALMQGNTLINPNTYFGQTLKNIVK